MATSENTDDLRREYHGADLDIESVAPDPFDQFRVWYDEAANVEEQEVNAMSLSTVGSDSTPSSRIVLLKNFNRDGFVFYTNYESQKGLELSVNNAGCLLFWWPRLAR